MLHSFADLVKGKEEKVIKEVAKHDRFKMIDSFHAILNHERAVKNELVVEKFRQEYDISKPEAIAKAKSMKYMWMPELSKRAIAIKVGHIKDTGDLRDFLDVVKRSSNQNRAFFGLLRVKK